MTTTRRPSLNRKGGFTLVELMIALTILTIVLGAMLSASVFLVRSSYILGNHVDMTNRGRFIAERIQKDLTSTVEVLKAKSARLELLVEDPDGNQQKVYYHYRGKFDNLRRWDETTKKWTVLAESMPRFKFEYYNSQDIKTSNLIDVKKVSFYMDLEGVVTPQEQYYGIESARWVLRNRTAG